MADTKINSVNMRFVREATSLCEGTYNKFLNSVFGIKTDGIIQDTKQGNNGDCWLLTDINALRDTPWGHKILKDSISADMNGDIIINFKGSRGEQKKFRISAEKLVAARESGKYSSGDDDMVALELAMEEYFTLYGDKHNREKTLLAAPGQNINGDGIGISEFAELLSGKKYTSHFLVHDDDISVIINQSEKDYYNSLDKMLSEIEKHPDTYASMVSFKHNWEGMYKEHAYQLKGVVTENDEKYIIVINPWNSSKEQKIPYNLFKANLSTIDVVENSPETQNKNLITPLQRNSILLKIRGGSLFGGLNRDTLNKEDFKELLDIIGPDTINTIFHDKDAIYRMIKLADLAEFGLGHGKNKKEIIAPMVDSYCEYARQKGIDEELINEVKTACYKELDATFYTNEEVIIEKLTSLYDAIQNRPKFSISDIFKNFGN